MTHKVLQLITFISSKLITTGEAANITSVLVPAVSSQPKGQHLWGSAH